MAFCIAKLGISLMPNKDKQSAKDQLIAINSIKGFLMTQKKMDDARLRRFNPNANRLLFGA